MVRWQGCVTEFSMAERLVVYAALICLSMPANSAIIVSNDGGVAMNISTMPCADSI